MTSKKYKLAVVIGRFEPSHLMHEHLFEEAYKVADTVLVLIGSASKARDTKNPFRFKERASMIESVFPNILTLPIEDYDLNDQWIMAVQTQVESIRNILAVDSVTNKEIVLVGHDKDASTFYLNLFPEWDKHLITSLKKMDATTIRNMIFECDFNAPGSQAYHDQLETYVSPKVAAYLRDWFRLPCYKELRLEYEKQVYYAKAWEAAPYKPTFVTADAVVTCAGHVLMVRRRQAPGKGLLALPGGFIEQNERVVDAILRELKEETMINVGKGLLMSHMGKVEYFDNPGRSLRGRTFTFAAHIALPFTTLPEVKGEDDAEVAIWVPFGRLASLREETFEDHQHVISRTTGLVI